MIRITIDGLRVRYDRHVALSIPELKIDSTILAVLGHNGAGKSTLLKTLLGLLAPQRGFIYATRDGKALTPENDMAFCPENGAVFEDISVSDYLKIWLRLRSKSDSLKASSVLELLELFEVDPLLKKFGRELSKGQRRRVQSVVGFLIEPKLFLFDEPFDGLDVQRTAELAKILESFKNRISFIISSHRMDVIERVADAGIVLANGKIVASGGISELSNQLAGKSLLLDASLATDSELIKDLEKQLALYVTHIGEQVVLTGPALNEQNLNEFFSKRHLTFRSAKEFNPTLTDAMGYHLQSLRVRPTEQK